MGLHKPENSFYIQPISKNKSFRGVCIHFSFEGVYHLLNANIINFTHKIVHIESILGKKCKEVIQHVSASKSDDERKDSLNQFFITRLSAKKKIYAIIVY